MKKALCKCYFVNEYTGGISSERFPVLVHLESGVPNFQSLTQERSRCGALERGNKITEFQKGSFSFCISSEHF